MKIKPKSRSKSRSAAAIPQKDPVKEAEFSTLAGRLAEAGYKVRRESLKRGHGYRVVSGSCIAQGERLIFVDRRMSQDEQIAFLEAKLAVLGISLEGEQEEPPASDQAA